MKSVTTLHFSYCLFFRFTFSHALRLTLTPLCSTTQGAHSTEAVLQHIGQTGLKAMCWSGPGLQTGPKARCWPVLCAAAHSQYWVLVWSGHPAHSYCHVLVCVPASTARSLLPTPSDPACRTE